MSLKDFKLANTLEGEDITFSPQNDWELVSEEDELAQSLSNLLRIATFEWFLNTKLGTQWFSVLGKSVDRETIELVIVEAITQDIRVQSVENINIGTIDSERTMAITVEVIAKLSGVSKTISVEVVV